MTPSPQELVEVALRSSRTQDCLVLVHETTAANLRWANNTLTTNGVGHRLVATVIAFHHTPAGVCVGSVSGSVATREQVEALVSAAERAAHATSPAEDAAPLARDLVDRDWDTPAESTDASVYRDLAPALGQEFVDAGRRGEVLYGFVNHEVTTSYLGSSTGLRRRHVQPTGHYGCTGKTADLSRSVWVGGATRDFREVDAHEMAAEVTRRLGWGRRQLELPAGRYDTVLPPTAVADLMIDAYWSAGARVAHEGQSVFSRPGGGTRIGERIARPGVRLSSDPARQGLECAPFVMTASSGNTSSVFDNGLPLAPTDWLSDGVLSALVQTRHTADLTGHAPTLGIDNLVLEVDSSSGGLDELVRGVERGLLLTCLWYIREVDPQTLLLTGLTRDGVYLVEDGEVTASVNNFRFNESPVDLLRRFSAAGATVPAFSREWGDDYFSRTAMPPLRVPDFNMSSVSLAR